MSFYSRNISMKFVVAVTFIMMVSVNALANTLPINGQTTGQVSETYPNLFAPAGITFAIWGIIYVALAVYTLYQWGFFQKKRKSKALPLEKIGFYFSVSSVVNATWIFAWHYNMILLSMLFMIVILVCLIEINDIIRKEKLSLKEKIFMRVPFSIYFGWITVATIANATTLLVSLGWDGFGISEPIWTVIIIIVGFFISITTILRNNDFVFGLVSIWAYIGILIKHQSPSGFDGIYPIVINTVVVCIGLFLIVEAFMLIKKLVIK